MTDARLRDLERRFAESGAATDEVALLVERARLGLLARDRLELAIYLGSQPARDALGGPPTVAPRAPRGGVLGWVFKLEPWGPFVSLRAAIAACRLLVKDTDTPPHEGLLLGLQAAEAYAVDPTPERVEWAKTVVVGTPTLLGTRWHGCRLCVAVVDFMQNGVTNHFVWKAKAAAGQVAEDLGKEMPVRAAIVRELLPWALGHGDPVRERVEARGAR